MNKHDTPYAAKTYDEMSIVELTHLYAQTVLSLHANDDLEDLETDSHILIGVTKEIKERQRIIDRREAGL